MRGLENLEEYYSPTSHNRRYKDAHYVYTWSSLHGAKIIKEGSRHDFVPSYVMCHGRGRDSDKEAGSTFLRGKNDERGDIKKTYWDTTVELNKV